MKKQNWTRYARVCALRGEPYAVKFAERILRTSTVGDRKTKEESVENTARSRLPPRTGKLPERSQNFSDHGHLATLRTRMRTSATFAPWLRPVYGNALRSHTSSTEPSTIRPEDFSNIIKRRPRMNFRDLEEVFLQRMREEMIQKDSSS